MQYPLNPLYRKLLFSRQFCFHYHANIAIDNNVFDPVIDNSNLNHMLWEKSKW